MKPTLDELVERWKTEIIKTGFQHYGSWADLAFGFALGAGLSFHQAGMFGGEVRRLKLIPKERGSD